MFGQKLAIQQFEPAGLEARDQMRERDLGGVPCAAEHAFAEEGRAQPHAIEAADELVVLPGFDRMGVTAPVQFGISGFDIGVDPGVGAARGRLRAMRHDFAERLVDGDGVAIRPDRLGERMREMETIEREHAALLRFDPEDIVRIARARHREHPDGVSAQQEVRVERGHLRQTNPIRLSREAGGSC